MRGNANGSGLSNRVKLNPRKEKCRVDMKQVELQKDYTCGQSCLIYHTLDLFWSLAWHPKWDTGSRMFTHGVSSYLVFHASFQKAFIKLKALVCACLNHNSFNIPNICTLYLQKIEVRSFEQSNVCEMSYKRIWIVVVLNEDYITWLLSLPLNIM